MIGLPVVVSINGFPRHGVTRLLMTLVLILIDSWPIRTGKSPSNRC